MQAQKHRMNVLTEKVRKDTTKECWINEAQRYEERADQRMEI